MKYDDLSFTIKNDKNEDIVCDIISVVPNDENEEEPYVVFTDYMLDSNNDFIMQYGKVIEIDGNFILKTINEEAIIDKIKNALNDDIISYVNEQIQDNIHE